MGKLTFEQAASRAHPYNLTPTQVFMCVDVFNTVNGRHEQGYAAGRRQRNICRLTSMLNKGT